MKSRKPVANTSRLASKLCATIFSSPVETYTFMDYGLPRADDVPSFGFVSHPVPCTTNPLGAKGCGEAGCAGSLPAIMNAMCDALGVTHIDMPATPEVVWRALNAAA